jgi:hypothetical protein
MVYANHNSNMRFNNAAKHLPDDLACLQKESSGQHKKFQKATKEILDNAPVTVYEEMSPEAFDTTGQPLFEIYLSARSRVGFSRAKSSGSRRRCT